MQLLNFDMIYLEADKSTLSKRMEKLSFKVEREIFSAEKDKVQARTKTVRSPAANHLHHHSTVKAQRRASQTASTTLTSPIMSIRSIQSPLRNSIRALEPWVCSSCSRSATRAPRARLNIRNLPVRRCFSTTKGTKQSSIPSMDQMQARYKEKNRTTMYGEAIGCGTTDFAN